MYLYGASGHAKCVIEILEMTGEPVEGIYDDNPDVNELFGYAVQRPFGAEPLPGSRFIVAIGNNPLRKCIADKFRLDYGRAIHPSAVISPRASLGTGTVVMGNVTVNSGAVIGGHVILNTNCSVDHDCILGDFVHISPNSCLTGGVVVAEGALIGAGAVILPGIHIGRWAVVGAGSVVTADVPAETTVAGNPARILKRGNGRVR